MGLFDKVVCGQSHEISRHIAMQQAQFYFTRMGAFLLLLAATPVTAAPITGPSKPDPLLDGGPTAPCAADTEYAAGADVNGRPVAPADIDTRRVPMPDAIAVPLARSSPFGARMRKAPGGDSAYITLDGRKLDPLVNPQPCR
jgi:hypothetical protein